MLSLLALLILSSSPAHARQVPGRATLPSDCTADEHFVSDHEKSTGPVSAHCRKNQNGYKFWQPKIRPQRPPNWPIEDQKAKAWDPGEREAVLDALAEIPPELWLESLRGIYRMRRSKGLTNQASSGGGHIVLYDSAFSKNEDLRRVLVHELAHEKFRTLSELDRTNYVLETGWKIDQNGKIFSPRACCYVQYDGKKSPD